MARRETTEERRSPCPIACGLDLLGDRWTLLVVRDLMFTKRSRFGELAASPEKIPTNILAERLRRLEAAKIVGRRAYQERPKRYAYFLTAKGKELFVVLAAMIRWGREHVPGVAQISEETLATMDPRVKGY